MNQKTIHLIPIEREDLRPYMRLAFEGDAELLSTFHIAAPGELDALVDDTMANVAEIRDNTEDRFYKVTCDGKDIGFTVSMYSPGNGHTYLLSFGINIMYRIKEIVLPWLQAVRDLLGNDFLVALYPRNTRAINFFTRNGLNNSKRVENYIILWQS